MTEEKKPSHVTALKKKHAAPYPSDWLLTPEEKAAIEEQTQDALAAFSAHYQPKE